MLFYFSANYNKNGIAFLYHFPNFLIKKVLTCIFSKVTMRV